MKPPLTLLECDARLTTGVRRAVGHRLAGSIAPPGNDQLSLSVRWISNSSPASLTTKAFADRTMLLALGADGSSK
jgi:hypothetical protein